MLLTASSRLGLSAELLLMRRQDTLLFATFLRQHHHVARIVWAGVAPVRGPIVRYVLEQGSRR